MVYRELLRPRVYSVGCMAGGCVTHLCRQAYRIFTPRESHGVNWSVFVVCQKCPALRWNADCGGECGWAQGRIGTLCFLLSVSVSPKLL